MQDPNPNQNKDKTQCLWGHYFTEDNTTLVTRRSDGTRYRQCKACKRRRDRESKARTRRARRLAGRVA